MASSLYAKKRVGGKLLKWLQKKPALELSGKAYGRIVSYGEAQSRIRIIPKVEKEGELTRRIECPSFR
jgi:hypothetical protein